MSILFKTNKIEQILKPLYAMNNLNYKEIILQGIFRD